MSGAALAADPITTADIAIEQPFDWTGVYAGAGVAYDVDAEEFTPAIYTGIRYQEGNSFVGAEIELYGIEPVFEGGQVTGRAGLVNETGAVYVLGGVDVDF